MNIEQVVEIDDCMFSATCRWRWKIQRMQCADKEKEYLNYGVDTSTPSTPIPVHSREETNNSRGGEQDDLVLLGRHDPQPQHEEEQPNALDYDNNSIPMHRNN